MKPRYAVLHYTLCDGWTNTWSVNDQPMTFDSVEEAQAELDEFLADIQSEIDSGDRAPDEGYSQDEFKIEEVRS